MAATVWRVLQTGKGKKNKHGGQAVRRVTLDRGRLTKSSSAAEPKVVFLGEALMVRDMSRSREASLLSSASKVVRKGLRDIGRLSELGRSAVVRRKLGEGMAGDERAGDAARLRNGLLEDRFRARPGDGRRSADDTDTMVSRMAFVRHVTSPLLPERI